eukprot:TRINITY_DN10736_c0_g3_i1.p1 TRINITY_DN10736_c0_g3~~TRINITY_DN10736_c0_g3_i1.p1  ORF type:complete len:105 (-),score=42.79 TRINITY_DN10736_c0_g3_i1:178-492(-)
MAVNLDRDKTGSVKYRNAASYLVLLESTLPSEKELAEYDIKLSVVCQGEWVAKEEFVKVEAWFDCCEECEQRDRAEKFDRVVMVKELLFDINKNCETVAYSRDS